MTTKRNGLVGFLPRLGGKWSKLLYCLIVIVILSGLSTAFYTPKAAADGCPSSPYDSGVSGVQFDVCLVNASGGQLSDTSGYTVKVQQEIGNVKNSVGTTYKNGQYYTNSNLQGGVGEPLGDCNGNQSLPYQLTALVTKGSNTYTATYNACNDQATYGYVIPVTVTAAAAAAQSQTGTLTGCVTYKAADGSTQPFNGSSTADGNPATATITGTDPGNTGQTISAGFNASGCLVGSQLSSIPAGSYTLTANFVPGQNSQGSQGELVYTKGFKITAGQTTDVSGTATAPAATGGTDTADANSKPACESSGFNLSWAVCPVIDAISDGEQFMETDLINPMLKTPPLQLSISSSCQSDGTGCTAYDNLFKIWSEFRIYGDILLLIALLVAIFSEAIGGGLIDAYTVKKMLPRLLAAAILVNLSIYIVAALIDISNIFGAGIYEVISAPFKNSHDWNITLNGLGADFTGFLELAVAGGAIWAIAHLSSAIPIILLFVGLPVLMIFLSIVITLLIRRAIIAFCIISSPLAFALYCLPNTEQYFKKWFDLLIKTLMVYPVVEVVFVMAGVTGVLVSSVSGPGGQMLGVVAKLAPLALIPFAFKISGGVINQIYSGANNIGKKITEGVKGNPNDRNSLRNKTKRRLAEDATRTQARAIGTRDYHGARKLPRRVLSKTADIFGNADARIAGYNKEAAERRDALTNFGNDDLIYAGAGYALEKGQYNYDGKQVQDKTYFNSKGKAISSDLYHKGKSLYGGSQHDITQGMGYTLYKAQTDDNVAAMQFAFNRNAEAGNWTQEQIEGNYLGATYPYKGQFGSVRYSVPKKDAAGNVSSPSIANDDENYYALLRDFHKTRPSFRLSEVRDQDWQNLHTRQQQLEGKVLGGTADAGDKQMLAMTYEMFDAASQELRTGAQTQAGTAPAGGGAAAPEISASGMTAASQSIIKDSVTSRQMDVVTTDPNTHMKGLQARPGPGIAGAGPPAPLAANGIYTTGDHVKDKLR